jgi:hypothetical protein
MAGDFQEETIAKLSLTAGQAALFENNDEEVRYQIKKIDG